nr:hypothetical protein [Tanacetum cinerariifolium]
MTTLAKFMIITDVENRHVLEKSLYDSWKSRMELYIENQEYGRMILNSLQNGPLVWPTVVEEDGTTRTKKYEELSVTEKLQAHCDLKATNIILQGLADPMFNQGDDPTAFLNKAMAFLRAVAFSRFLSTNNQLRTSSNLRNQATIQDGRLLCNKFKGGKDKVMLTEDLDAYDPGCDDVSNAKAVLMDNLSNYGYDVILEKAQRIKPTLYDGSVISSQHVASIVIDDEETLILKELQTSHPNTDQSASLLVEIEAPKELPKEHIKSIKENVKEEKVKHEMDEIKTINIKLEHSVAKLLSKNEHLHKEIEHLKKIYKIHLDQFDSIKKTHALSKEQCDSLIAQLNSKSKENSDLKGQIQEKGFVTTALQSELRRLNGKHVLDYSTTITNATTIAQGMFKLDIKHISKRLKNNRDAHANYLKKTIENTDTIRGLVERARKQNPNKPLLDSSCKFTKHVQE